MSNETAMTNEMRRGHLGKELFVITSTPVAPREELERLRPRHLQHQTRLEQDGVLFAAGPLFNEDGSRAGGLIIIRADSFTAAQSIAGSDPYHAEGLRSYTMQRWTVNEGSYTLRVTYSDQKVAVI
jgi:uncharacterized protein YciI